MDIATFASSEIRILPTNFAQFVEKLLSGAPYSISDVAIPLAVEAPTSYFVALSTITNEALREVKKIIDTRGFSEGIIRNYLETLPVRDPTFADIILAGIRKYYLPQTPTTEGRNIDELYRKLIELQDRLKLIGSSPHQDMVYQRLLLINDADKLIKDWSSYENPRVASIIRELEALIGQAQRFNDMAVRKESPFIDVQIGDTEKIERGLQTAITTPVKVGKAGDVITFNGGDKKYVITYVKQIESDSLQDPEFVAALSRAEGVNVALVKSMYPVGSWVTFFRPLEAEPGGTTEVGEITETPLWVDNLVEAAANEIERAIKLMNDPLASLTDLQDCVGKLEIIAEQYHGGVPGYITNEQVQWIRNLADNLKFKINELKDRTMALVPSLSSVSFTEAPSFVDRVTTLAQKPTISIGVNFATSEENAIRMSARAFGSQYVPIDISRGLEVNKELLDRITRELNAAGSSVIHIGGNELPSFFRSGRLLYTQGELDRFVYRLLSSLLEQPDLKIKLTEVFTSGQSGIGEAVVKAASVLGLKVSVVAPTGWEFKGLGGSEFGEDKFKERFLEKAPVQVTRETVQEEGTFDLRRLPINLEMIQAAKTAAPTNIQILTNIRTGEALDTEFSGPVHLLAERGLKTSVVTPQLIGQRGDVITINGRPQKYIIVDVREIPRDAFTNPEFVSSLSRSEHIQPFAMTESVYKPGRIITYFVRLEDAELAAKAAYKQPVGPAIEAIRATIRDYPLNINISESESVSGSIGPAVELAERGLKTSVVGTRPLGTVGDLITFNGRPTKYIITGTKLITPEDLLSATFLRELSGTEGLNLWAITSKYRDVYKPGSWVTYFKKVDGQP
ncbi:MAG: hypothetical protein N2578_00705 [Bdellovibrionaceae bacterium]|nr:hypothetical protein [Pseudobdellovibrionaceae bacterium]